MVSRIIRKLKRLCRGWGGRFLHRESGARTAIRTAANSPALRNRGSELVPSICFLERGAAGFPAAPQFFCQHRGFLRARWASRKSTISDAITAARKNLVPIKNLAGAEGFEPSPSTLTVWCPTGWTTPQLELRPTTSNELGRLRRIGRDGGVF